MLPLLLLLACHPAPASSPDASSPAANSPPLPAEFWPTWGDGNAEVATYDLIQPRYGSLRTGTATLIYVTEDFSWSARIKADPTSQTAPAQHPDSDIRKVLKLNLLRDFQTGIYTYHTMTSTFARVDPGDDMARWDPLKISTSVQEWCGHVLERWTPSPRRVTIHRETYFDSDDDAGGNDNPPLTLTAPPTTIYGDDLPILVRQLGGDWVKPGATLQAPYFPRQIDVRFDHTAPAFSAVVITRSPPPTPAPIDSSIAGSEQLRSGTFHCGVGDVRADIFTAAITGGATLTYDVEAAWPHRLLGWSSTTGESAVLRGIDRLPYWNLHNPGDEVNLKRIGQ